VDGEVQNMLEYQGALML